MIGQSLGNRKPATRTGLKASAEIVIEKSRHHAEVQNQVGGKENRGHKHANAIK
jgi:hypothetical protein